MGVGGSYKAGVASANQRWVQSFLLLYLFFFFLKLSLISVLGLQKECIALTLALKCGGGGMALGWDSEFTRWGRHSAPFAQS